MFLCLSFYKSLNNFGSLSQYSFTYSVAMFATSTHLITTFLCPSRVSAKFTVPKAPPPSDSLKENRSPQGTVKTVPSLISGSPSSLNLKP